MEDLDKTIPVDIRRLPTQQEPPLSSKQKWGLILTGALVVALVLYYAVLLSGERNNTSPEFTTGALARGLKPGPPIDLVSGEPIKPEEAKFRAEFYGTELYFSSRENLDAFRKDPLAYVKLKANVKVKMQDEGPVESAAPEPEAAPEPPAPAAQPPRAASPPPAPPVQTVRTVKEGSWTEATDPPPPVGETLPAPDAIPAPPSQPAMPKQPARPKQQVTEEFAEDVIVTEVEGEGSDPLEGEGDIILESVPMDSKFQNEAPRGRTGRPGPSGPARPLR